MGGGDSIVRNIPYIVNMSLPCAPPALLREAIDVAACLGAIPGSGREATVNEIRNWFSQRGLC